MSTAVKLLHRLSAKGIVLWREGEKLRFRGPAGAVDDAIRAELAAMKPQLLDLLRQGETNEDSTIRPVDRSDPLPLSVAQERLWFIDQLDPGAATYNVFDVLPLDHEIDAEALRHAMRAVISRHESLRTVFPAEDGRPVQKVLPPFSLPIPVIDLSHLQGEAQESEWRRLAGRQTRTPFDLARGPLVDATLLRLGPARYIWVLTLHHIICDDWSKKLLNEELEEVYRASLEGRPPVLPPLPIQWADFAAWQRKRMTGAVLERHVAFWKRELSGELPALSFAADHAPTLKDAGRNGRFYFTPVLSSALRTFAEQSAATLFMVLLAGFSVLLSRHTRQQDILLGSPISDRQGPETDRLIGFMLDTLLLRVRVDETETFRCLVARVRETCLNAYSFQSVPYEALMRDLKVDRGGAGGSLFQVMIGLLNTPDIGGDADGPLWGRSLKDHVPDLSGEIGTYEPEENNGTSKFDLSITFAELGSIVWGRTEFNGAVFSDRSMEALIVRLQVLLLAAVRNPDVPIIDLPWMTADEAELVTGGWCQGRAIPSTVNSPVEWLDRWASSHPEATAIDDDGAAVGYGELKRRADIVAAALKRAGATQGTAVGVLLDRSADLIVALWGVLRSGAVCVPFDTTYPDDRLSMVAADAGMTLLVTTKELSARLPIMAGRVLLDGEMGKEAGAPLPPAPGSDVACLLYTSGSTGRPKGVAITHAALANYATEAALDYGVGHSDRILQFASPAFDGCWEEMMVAACAGSALVVRPARMIDTATGFLDHCDELRLTALMLPTAYWHEIVSVLAERSLPPRIHSVVVGGERVIPERLAEWQRYVGHRVRLMNTYGPTEGTIAVTRCLLPPVPEDLPPREVCIGRPVANTIVRVLDSHMRPTPPGVPGELYLGGAALARGYAGRPDLTAERFVADPFAHDGSRLYRTGDLVRFLHDGTLQYIGRLDNQVKIRGYRVELREIELTLLTYPDVADVKVIVAEDVPGERRLVAYVVMSRPGIATVPELRAFLRGRLPAFMIPSGFMLLASMPLNNSGKVDVRALPRVAAAGDLPLEQFSRLRGTETEERLIDIWRLVLGIDHLSPEDSFFDLGGHSLIATRMVARINKAFGIDLPLRRLFEAETIAELAPIVDELTVVSTGSDDRIVSLRSQNERDVEIALAGFATLSDAELRALLGEDAEPGAES